MILTMEDLDGDPMDDYDHELETEEGQQAKNFSERLKREICTLIDAKTSASLEEMFRQRDAFNQLMEAERHLGIAGFRGGDVRPLIERIQALVDENQKLKKQIKDTDELLLAKRHYHPLMIKLLQVAQERDDQETINRIHCFMLEGKII